MEINEPKCLVQDVQDNRVLVRFASHHCLAMLLPLGGHESKEGFWVCECRDETDMAALFGKLRDNGVAFQGGQSGWPPAAIFTLLRGKGSIQGPFQEAVFGGPKAGWIIRER